MVIFARKPDIQRIYKKHKTNTPDMEAVEQLRKAERRMPSNFWIKLINYSAEMKILKKKPDSEFVHLCLAALHTLGAAVYKKMTKKMKWIPDRILMHMFDAVKFPPGINSTLNQIISLKFELASKRDKLCTIILDEVPLRRHLASNGESVDGYEDDGVTKTDSSAKFATYVMIRSMFADWQLPVAYTFNSKPATADQLRSLLFSALLEMRKIGLIVKVVIGKLRANVCELTQQLGISPTQTTFNMEGQDYYFMFDSSQLMNSTRNNLMKYAIRFGNQHASWHHLLKYYEACVMWGHPFMPLDITHIRPSKHDLLNINNSTQVLSCQVAKDMTCCMEEGLLDRSATGTIEFISFFGKLFRFMDSTHVKCRDEFCEAYTGNTKQLNFIERSCQFLDKLQVHSGSRNITRDVKFITAWKINLTSLRKMWATVQTMLKTPGEREASIAFQHLMLHRMQASCTMLDMISVTPIVTSNDFKSYFKFCFIKEYMEHPFNAEQDLDERIKIICRKIPKRSDASASTVPV